MLKEKGLRKAVSTVLHDQYHGMKSRVVSVNWKLIGSNEQPIADMDFLYVLIGGDGAWKIGLANLI